jgi:uncharacterized protein
MPTPFSALNPALLQSAPIRPEWVIEGQPLARSHELSRSNDGTAVSMHWSCTAGTFYWYFSIDETVCIVEGEVQVRAQDGQKLTLRTGDTALFRAGTWYVWHVPVMVRKIAFCRQAMPWLLGAVLRRFNGFWERRALRRGPVGLG